MLEQFDDETKARLLKDQPEPKRWKDMTPDEQAAVTARKEKRQQDEQNRIMRSRIEEIWRRKVPERYQSVRLKSLTPSPKSHMPEDKQRVIIEIMQKAPTAGYAFRTHRHCDFF
jgi:hypothetical protein